ncbi:hypothetical protein BT67DRAFT_434434 [Trichocladium antarcticum]|uniref:Uncharacterized protein n=1 Tax=Trichocladium antarcticum TaxID=1450529 RepID=A0AAN6UKP3_9PEZI|nr:hypothetical protein BT67DRAFT_434434 [Trichocladium antarcticum]
MPARPRTSSGPGSGKSAGARPNFDKRHSKDDLALMLGSGRRTRDLPPHTVRVTGVAQHGPRRGRMPSPPARMSTPESVASGEIPIGMALGSPTRDTSPYALRPLGSNPYAGWETHSKTVIQSSHSPPPVQQTPEPALQRTKTQRRRLFGLFGSRKNAEPATAGGAVEPGRSTTSATAPRARGNVTPARSNTVGGKKITKHTPILIRPPTVPQVEVTAPGPMPQQTPPTADVWPGVSAPSPSLASAGSGLLGIEIPDVRLERYSVMFSGVLNPNAPRPSLLERRQATLEVKTIGDRIEEEGPERTRLRTTRSRGAGDGSNNLPGPAPWSHARKYLAGPPSAARESKQ